MKLYWQPGTGACTGHRTVFFPGGFQLVVVDRDRQWRTTHQRRWRVWWGDAGPDIRGLTDRWFKTRIEAMRAAEAIFVPMLIIARGFYKVETRLSGDGAWFDRPPDATEASWWAFQQRQWRERDSDLIPRRRKKRSRGYMSTSGLKKGA